MFRRIQIFVVASVLLVCSCESATSKIGSNSRSNLEVHEALVVTPTDVNIGTVVAGKILTAEFSVVNNGTVPVRNLSVVTGCGCINSELSSGTLAGGGKASIKLKIDSTGKRGKVALASRIEGQCAGQSLSQLFFVNLDVVPRGGTGFQTCVSEAS